MSMTSEIGSQLLTLWRIGFVKWVGIPLWSMGKRLSQYAKFGSRNKPILVATDVANQSLDVPDVLHVVNYDLHKKIATYVPHDSNGLGRHIWGTPPFSTSLVKPLVLESTKSLIYASQCSFLTPSLAMGHKGPTSLDPVNPFNIQETNLFVVATNVYPNLKDWIML